MVKPPKITMSFINADEASVRLGGLGWPVEHLSAVTYEPVYLKLANRNPMPPLATTGAFSLDADGMCWTLIPTIPDTHWNNVRSGIPIAEVVRPGHGFYPVLQQVLPRTQAATGWALLQLDQLRMKPLPPYMSLSEYDIGHQVVITDGELMGTTGMVSDIRDGSYAIGATATHRASFLGVIRTGLLEADQALAPLRLRCPPGSKVWVVASAGWEPGVMSEFGSDATVDVWLTRRKESWRLLRNRNSIRARVDATPPPFTPEVAKERNVPPARRAPGSAGRWSMGPTAPAVLKNRKGRNP